MIFIALAIAVLIVFVVQGRIYKKHALENIECKHWRNKKAGLRIGSTLLRSELVGTM